VLEGIVGVCGGNEDITPRLCPESGSLDRDANKELILATKVCHLVLGTSI
jgi:hypothetical protein